MDEVLIDLDSGEEIQQKLVSTEPEGTQEEQEPNLEEEHEEGEGSGEPSGDNDPELENASDDYEREAIRERRREERRNRKQAQREREDSLRRELAARDSIINEMRGRLDAVERRNTGSEVAQIEQAKKQTAQTYAYFKEQIRLGTEAGNGAAVAEATEKMLQAQRKFDELTNYERAYKQQGQSSPALDPRLINNAKEWMDRNKWYDPSAKDPDSRIVLTLDQQLAEEGWNPTTKEYWKELETRVKKYLPHRQNRDKISNNKPRSVVTGSGREGVSAVGQGAKTYRLSAERVQALKDAGIWDDPKQRAEAVKRFRDFDKENKA